MSFEGYYQCFCKNGHYFTNPAGMYYDEEDQSCPDCHEEPVIKNLVDDTNCDGYGVIPPHELEKLLVSRAKTKTCPTCGHCEETSPEVYRVPTQEELGMLRHYRLTRDGQFYYNRLNN